MVQTSQPHMDTPRKRFMIVGNRNGKAAIYWPGALRFALFAGVIYYVLYVAVHRVFGWPLQSATYILLSTLGWAGVYVAFIIFRLMRTPPDRLPPMD